MWIMVPKLRRATIALTCSTFGCFDLPLLAKRTHFCAFSARQRLPVLPGSSLHFLDWLQHLPDGASCRGEGVQFPFVTPRCLDILYV